MAKVPEIAENFKLLREQALKSNWRKLGLAPTEKNPNVWGVIMEIGYPGTVVTLVCINNGTVNIYFGNGGGITGGGEYEAIRMKAEEFIHTAEVLFKKLNPTKKYPLPDVDRVRFYILTFKGIFTAQDNRNIAKEDHELFPLLHSGHQVIAALRAVDHGAESSSK